MNRTATYRLADGVTLRRERFGGLIYHHNTRRLYVLRSPLLTELIGGLDGRRPLDLALHDVVRERALPPTAAAGLLRALSDIERMQLIVAA